METDQEAAGPAGSCPVTGQAPIRTWLPSSKRGATAARTLTEPAARFQGEGVRYKAKLIGMDRVPQAQGDKMCLDSMMKLKGLEIASRNHGKHKQRVWLKISSSGLKIVDERNGVTVYEHESSRISSLRKDETDPRALAYVYQQQDAFTLFYIKTSNLADPVLDDMKEVCQRLDQEPPQEPVETQTQNSSLLLLDETSEFLPRVPGDVDLSDPRLQSSPEQQREVSSNDELMEIFSVQLQEPMKSSQHPGSSQPGSPQQTLSVAQILSNYPAPPAGGTPYSSHTGTTPWSLTGPLQGLSSLSPAPTGQWVGPAPWPQQPGGLTAWGPTGGQIQSYGLNHLPGVYLNAGNHMYAPAGAPGPQQPPTVSPTVSPTTPHQPSLL